MAALPTHTRKLRLPPAPLLIPSHQAEYPFPPSEKSPLPAIIVTPSSPTGKHDFSIAFLAPPPPPTRTSVFTSVYNYFFPAPSTSNSNGYQPIPATPATGSHFPPTPGPHREVHMVNGGLPSHHTPGYMVHRPAATAVKRLRRTLLLTIPVAAVAFHLISYKYQFGLGFGEGEYGTMQEHQPGGGVVATGL